MTLFHSTIAALAFIACSMTAAHAGAHCDKHPGDFLGVDHQCHSASAAGKVKRADQSVQSDPTPVGDSDVAVFAAFKKDCELHHGVVYDARAWNELVRSGKVYGHLIQKGQKHCHAGAFIEERASN